jgi:hypothetical protein
MTLGQRLRTLGSIFALVAAGACSAAVDEAPSGTTESTEVRGELRYELDENRLRGSFVTERGDVEFSALEKDGRLYDVTVELNGVVLSVLFATDEKAADFDGFTAGTGDPTLLRDEDRMLLGALERAITKDEKVAASSAGTMLEHAVSLWSEMSSTYPLVRAVHGDENKTYQSLCSLCHQYVAATHDCNVCSDYQAACTSNVQLGERGATTSYWVNGAWTTQPPDHVAGLWETGECFGNCGLGCPTDWQQQLTQDCANHDQCVRNGHRIVTSYCDDDFTLAIDDELYAPWCTSTGGAILDTRTVTCTNVTFIPKLGWIGSCICPSGYSLISINGSTGTCRKTSPVVSCP